MGMYLEGRRAEGNKKEPKMVVKSDAESNEKKVGEKTCLQLGRNRKKSLKKKVNINLGMPDR